VYWSQGETAKRRPATRPSYLEGASAAWIASTIAHEAYHVKQSYQGQVYNLRSAHKMEREANRFQMRVGAKSGLSPSESEYLNKDTHTLYNGPPD